MQSETQEIIKSIINRLYEKKYINFKQLTYLYGPESPRTCLFYLLPKIHKAPESGQSWTDKLREHFQNAQHETEQLQNFKITAYRRSKNLKGLLVHMALNKKRSGNDP